MSSAQGLVHNAFAVRKASLHMKNMEVARLMDAPRALLIEYTSDQQLDLMNAIFEKIQPDTELKALDIGLGALLSASRIDSEQMSMAAVGV